jgi:hypothetical protein
MAKYNIGDVVLVHRRVDPYDNNSPREWARAKIVGGPLMSRAGETGWRVAFADRYTGAKIYVENRLQLHRSRGVLPDIDVDLPHPIEHKLTFNLPKPKKLHDNCPKCGHRGNFIRMALVCPVHGVWAGC